MTQIIGTDQTSTLTIASNEPVVVRPGVLIEPQGGTNAIEILPTVEGTLDMAGAVATEEIGVLLSGNDTVSLAPQGLISADVGFSDITPGGPDGDSVGFNDIVIGGSVTAETGVELFSGVNDVLLTGTMQTSFASAFLSGDANNLTTSGGILSEGVGVVSFGDGSLLNLGGAIDTDNYAALVDGAGNVVSITGDTATGTNGVIALGEGNSVSVSGTLSAGERGIIIEGDGSDAAVSGDVAARAEGIDVEGNDNTMNVSGSVRTPDGAGARIQGSGNILLVTGEIRSGGVSGVTLSGFDNRLVIASQGTVYNDGGIAAVLASVEAPAEYGPNQTTVVNNGLIVADQPADSPDAPLAVRDGVELSTNQMAVINRGLILGSVELNAGDDFFRGARHQAVAPRHVQDGDILPRGQPVPAFLFLDGHSGIVSHLLAGAGQTVEEG